MTRKYGVEWNVNYYGTGGGSIFNAKTFLANYDRVINIFDEEFDYIKRDLCGNFGWVDVWMLLISSSVVKNTVTTIS